VFRVYDVSMHSSTLSTGSTCNSGSKLNRNSFPRRLRWFWNCDPYHRHQSIYRKLDWKPQIRNTQATSNKNKYISTNTQSTPKQLQHNQQANLLPMKSHYKSTAMEQSNWVWTQYQILQQTNKWVHNFNNMFIHTIKIPFN
jgi:hypothetical protein